MRIGSETVAVGTEKAIRKGTSKAKEKIAEKKTKKNAENQVKEPPAIKNSASENKPEQQKMNLKRILIKLL